MLLCIVKNWLLALSSRKLQLFFFLFIGDDNNFLEEVKVTDIKEDKSKNQMTTTEAIQGRVFKLDMTYFEIQDGQLKLTSKFKKR